MLHTHLFSYNVPAENHYVGKPDFFIHVIAEWDGTSFYGEGRPMVHINPINLSFYEAVCVKDWAKAKNDIEKLAENHFAEIAKMERISRARAVLAVEENPVMQRLIVNHFTPVS